MRTIMPLFSLGLLLATTTAVAEVPVTTLDPWADELEAMAEEAAAEASDALDPSGSEAGGDDLGGDPEPAVVDDDTEAAAHEERAPRGETCAARPVTVSRFGTHPPERVQLALVGCSGAVDAQARRVLSAIARARGADEASRELSAGVVDRLRRVAERFPEHELVIVSGYRPTARPGSRHRSGNALDLRVDGVANETLRDFLLQLPDTGVGYYPNSTFVHVDARPTAAYWVDYSGPGEPARYARTQPARARDAMLANAGAAREVDVDAMVRAALAEAAQTLASLDAELELPVLEDPPRHTERGDAAMLAPAVAEVPVVTHDVHPPAEPAAAATAAGAAPTAPEARTPEPPSVDEAAPQGADAPLVVGEAEDGLAANADSDDEDEARLPTPAPPTSDTGDEGGYDAAELRALSDAALFRMNDAFGRHTALSKALPDKPVD